MSNVYKQNKIILEKVWLFHMKQNILQEECQALMIITT